MTTRPSQLICIGGSAGSSVAFKTIVCPLPVAFPTPLVFAQHLPIRSSVSRTQILKRNTLLSCREIEDKAPIKPGVWLAPPGYHVLIDRDQRFALDVDARVLFSRPSIDLLFESAARFWGASTIAVLLTGANDDGTRGLGAVKKAGGHTIVQNPDDAEFPFMPCSAIDAGVADETLSLDDIRRRLTELAG